MFGFFHLLCSEQKTIIYQFTELISYSESLQEP